MAALLFQQCHGRNGGRLPGGEQGFEIFQRAPGVDDVLHKNDVAAGNGLFQIPVEPHHARGAGAETVAGDGDEVHVYGTVHAAAQIHIEKARAFQNADQNRPQRPKAPGEDPGKLGHPMGYLLPGEQNPLQIVYKTLSVHRKPPAEKNVCPGRLPDIPARYSFVRFAPNYSGGAKENAPDPGRDARSENKKRLGENGCFVSPGW